MINKSSTVENLTPTVQELHNYEVTNDSITPSLVVKFNNTLNSTPSPSYNPNTGIELAGLLGSLIFIFTLYCIYKQKCKKVQITKEEIMKYKKSDSIVSSNAWSVFGNDSRNSLKETEISTGDCNSVNDCEMGGSLQNVDIERIKTINKELVENWLNPPKRPTPIHLFLVESELLKYRNGEHYKVNGNQGSPTSDSTLVTSNDTEESSLSNMTFPGYRTNTGIMKSLAQHFSLESSEFDIKEESADINLNEIDIAMENVKDIPHNMQYGCTYNVTDNLFITKL